MAEDHGLCNGKDHIELFDGVQRLFLTLQPDDIWVGDHLLCKPPHRVLKGCREKQHLTVLRQLSASALVPVTLCGNHHISLIQHKHSNLLGVNDLVLGAPVEDCAWCTDDNLLLQLDSSLHCVSNKVSVIKNKY
uniref:Uncharacterized protein n=1 Tax=Amphilophus citrinellus TaxID=61819 RepID=A0A3Q0S9N5_AMPCI